MFHPDTDSARQLVRQRQAELARDWERLGSGPPDVRPRRRRRRQWRLRLAWLRTHPRPAGHAS